MSEATMQVIAEQARVRAQSLLVTARNAMVGVEGALAEVAVTPLFSNGLGASLRAASTTATQLDADLESLQRQIDAYFRPDVDMDQQTEGAR